MSPSSQNENAKGQNQVVTKSSYSNWLTECENLAGKTLEGNYLLYISLLESYVKEAQPQKPEHVEEFQKELNRTALEHVMDQSALAFFYYKINNASECIKWLENARSSLSKYMTGGQIPSQFQQSFNILFKSIFLTTTTSAAERKSKVRQPLKFVINVSDNKSSTFACYKLKHTSFYPEPRYKRRACMFGIKQHFFRLLRMDYEQEIQLLQKAIRRDRHVYYWHLKLYDSLRKCRRQGQYHHYQTRILPGEEEQKAIQTACRLQPDHPLCLVGEIWMLADQVKAQTKESNWTVIEHNGVEYNNKEQLVLFIKDQSKKIMELAPTSIECHARIAEIFNKLVTRDIKFSEDCLKGCLIYHPNSVFLNFRLVECLLGRKSKASSKRKQRIISEAQQRLEEALENCSYTVDFAPFVCLIQILMGQPEENEEKLLGLFEEGMNNPLWNQDQLETLLFLKALFCLKISSRNDEGIDILCSICDKDETCLKFDDLQYQSDRYGWKLKGRVDLTLFQVRDKIRNAIKLNTHCKTTLEKMLIKGNEAIEAHKKLKATWKKRNIRCTLDSEQLISWRINGN